MARSVGRAEADGRPAVMADRPSAPARCSVHLVRRHHGRWLLGRREGRPDDLWRARRPCCHRASAVVGRLSGFGRRRRAASSTWSMVSTRTSLICLRISSGTSRRSFSFLCGRMTVLAPERCAARILLLRPPIGRTRPRRVISPVIATSLRTGMPVKRADHGGGHGDACRRTVLGDGARRDVDVQGVLLERLLREAQLLGVRADPGQAGRADSRITSPSWPVRMKSSLPSIG